MNDKELRESNDKFHQSMYDKLKLWLPRNEALNALDDLLPLIRSEVEREVKEFVYRLVDKGTVDRPNGIDDREYLGDLLVAEYDKNLLSDSTSSTKGREE